MSEETIIGFDLGLGASQSALVVSEKRPNGGLKVLATMYGDAAIALHRELATLRTRAETAEARVAELEAENVHLAGQAMCEGERANDADAERDAMRSNLTPGDRVGPDGAYVVVPVEPTEKMKAASYRIPHARDEEIYAAMLSTLQGEG